MDGENKIYTGIGSRETPKEIIDMMEILAERFFNAGYTLRSGGADGADLAFERGLANASEDVRAIQRKAQIYLPWPSFNSSKRTWIDPYLTKPSELALEEAPKYVPYWKYLKHGAKLLHARNLHQMFGRYIQLTLLPDFVVCWTKNGETVGGTATALRIAREFDVPVYNLFYESAFKELCKKV